LHDLQTVQIIPAIMLFRYMKENHTSLKKLYHVIVQTRNENYSVYQREGRLK